MTAFHVIVIMLMLTLVIIGKPTTGASAIRGSSPTSAETQGSEEPITPRVASDQSLGCGSNNLISISDNISIKNNGALHILFFYYFLALSC